MALITFEVFSSHIQGSTALDSMPMGGVEGKLIGGEEEVKELRSQHVGRIIRNYDGLYWGEGQWAS